MRRAKRSRKQIFFWLLSVIVVVSMVCGSVAILIPPRQPEPITPTPVTPIVIPTWTPTATPDVGLSPATPAPPQKQPPASP
jgi:hypothetical protein